ncbi:MAG TPA: gas vesicle accessory protein GvpU [Longimicrobium sp.]|nr:gas vesicle accessory protein GvpU [Longimicrobium sp.]
MAQDYALEVLVSLAEKHDFNVTMTLSVRGSVVTGELISSREWGKAFAAQLGHDAESMRRDEGAKAETATDDAAPIEFVHLRNASYIGGAGLIPASGGLLWRGKASQVDAFSVGMLKRG